MKTIKKLLVIALIAAPFMVSAQSAAKFAKVNVQEIFQLMPETAAANLQLQEVSKKYEDENLKMREELDKKYNEYVSQRDSLPENIRARREQEIQEISQRISTFMEVAQRDIEQQQQSMIAPIQAKLMEAVQEISEAADYVYVMDINALVFSGSQAEDITPIVKEKLGIAADATL